MNSQNLKLFLKKLSTIESLYSDLAQDYPDLKPAVNDLIYPIQFLQRLAQESEEVLQNNPNSIERMRYLLVPALTEQHAIREAVSELLPREEDYDQPDEQIEINNTFIHYGALVMVALAAGRVGMQPFNLYQSTDDFIDVIEFYALATLPVQSLARVLWTGFDIDNFVLALRHQIKSGRNYILLKSLARTIFDRRELASAMVIHRLTKEVKNFFNDCDNSDGWDSVGSLEIEHTQLLSKVKHDNHTLRVFLTKTLPKKENLTAYFIWESNNIGDNPGYVIRDQEINIADYKLGKDKKNLLFEDYNHPAGWIGLQADRDKEASAAFTARFKEYWEHQNKSDKSLNIWPVPLDKFPDAGAGRILLPILMRSSHNKWGPEIIDKTIQFPTANADDDLTSLLAKVELKFISDLTPFFKLVKRSDGHELQVKTHDVNGGGAILEFSLDQLPADEFELQVSIYTENRNAPYDSELVDIEHWQQAVGIVDQDQSDSTDKPGSDQKGDDVVCTPVPGNGSSFIKIVVLRPGIISPKVIDSDYAAGNQDEDIGKRYTVNQLSADKADNALSLLKCHTGLNLDKVDLPYLDDDEATLHANSEELSNNEQKQLLDNLITAAERTEGVPDAIWISLVEQADPFYLVALSTNSNGLIVSTQDALPQAYDQLRLLKGSNSESKAESTVNFSAHVFNGALTIDNFIKRGQRNLSHNHAPVPSQWIALGYSSNRQLLFERRIKLPFETYSGDLTISLPNYPHLDKIELRYRPELFAIEVTSLSQPQIAEASVRLLSNASVLRGSTFRQVTPTPKTRLLTLQKVSGNVGIKTFYEIHTNSLIWQDGQSTGRDTRVQVYVRSNVVSRLIAKPVSTVKRLDLDTFVVKDSEALNIRAFEVVASDGWNSAHSSVSKNDADFKLDHRTILPRFADGGYAWADPEIIPYGGEDTLVNWLLDGVNFLAESVPLNYVVVIPENADKSSIAVEFADNQNVEVNGDVNNNAVLG